MFLLKVLDWFCKLLILACIVFWLIVPIVTISVHSDSSNTEDTWHSSRPYNRNQNNRYENQKKAETLYEKEQRKKLIEDANKLKSMGLSANIDFTSDAVGDNPDDVASEGYENGYEQGQYDKENGYSYGNHYDESSSYYNYYETRYKEGYEEGYYDGYNN